VVRIAVSRTELRRIDAMAAKRGMRRPYFIAFALRENLKLGKPHHQAAEHAN
jgi:hypothetical protein